MVVQNSNASSSFERPQEGEPANVVVRLPPDKPG